MTQFKVCKKCNRIVPWGISYCPMCGALLRQEGNYNVVELDPDKTQDEKDQLELDRRLGK